MRDGLTRKLIVFLVSITIAVLNTWPYDYIWSGDWNKIHYASLSRHANQLIQKPENETPHEYRMKYRLTAPCIAKLSPDTSTYGRMRFLMLVMALTGIAFWALFYRHLSKHFSDPDSRDILMLMLGLTHFPHAFFGDITGVFDAFGYFGILLAFISPKAWIRFPALTLACWTDERSVFAALFILLIDRILSEKRESLADFLVSARCLSILLALALYLPLRLYLQLGIYHDGLSSGPQAGIDMLQYNLKRIPLSYFTFAAYWGVAGMACIQLLRKNKIKEAVLLCCAGAALCASSFLIIDITRSQAYFFPWMIASMNILSADSFQPAHKPQRFWLGSLFLFAFILAALGKAL